MCSAGTQPVGLKPGSIDAMVEVGIDISRHRSKSVTEFTMMPFDCVIRVCDRTKETCPRWLGPTRLIHWSFGDPAAVADADDRPPVFRRVRDEIAVAIRQSLADREKQGS